MAKLVLTMSMSLDGFFCGPGGDLDWITQTPDPEFSRDNVASFDRFDRGVIGYPTASGMLPFWLNEAGNVGRCSEEDDMSDTAPALDQAFERMAAASFELPNGFVNHGAVACEGPA